MVTRPLDNIGTGVEKLQTRLQHHFAIPALLVRALTHRSFSADHNERLEFLGDSVLQLAMTALLYEQLPTQSEGELSRLRAHLVKQESLHAIALQLELPGLMRLGEGECKSGGRLRPSMLADALEAIIGAVYLDAGYGVAQGLVQRLFRKVQWTPDLLQAAKDAKTSLQEWLQSRKMPPPHYQVVRIDGAGHQQVFHVHCEIARLQLRQSGSGTSRRAAEQVAAAAMLTELQNLHDRN